MSELNKMSSGSRISGTGPVFVGANAYSVFHLAVVIGRSFFGAIQNSLLQGAGLQSVAHLLFCHPRRIVLRALH